ncbi:hypothetical protein [Leifsonia sp. AG29]|uniref:hypothetical protein n=1 Tax=Leifsonia sp. AG29 TaxID=2598860 RepID=UPI00131E8EDF|nr:hypothetical protein [Leifsonia sp. AG29]
MGVANHGDGHAMRILARGPIGLYAVAASVGVVGLLTGVSSLPLVSGILVVAVIFFVLSLTAAYFTVKGVTGPPASSGFIGQLFAMGFWRGSRAFRVTFVLLGTIAALTFSAGAVVLPRGTTVEKVGDASYSVNSGHRQVLSSAEALYLQSAQHILVPIGLALVLSVFSAGLLRGVAVARRERAGGLTRDMWQ